VVGFAMILDMLIIYYFLVHDEIGRGNFLAIYFASGAMGSIFSLTRSVLLGRLGMTSLGASAATSGIVAAWCMSHFEYVSHFLIFSSFFKDTTNPFK
jgi:membrane associated rhomboid family serine protease